MKHLPATTIAAVAMAAAAMFASCQQHAAKQAAAPVAPPPLTAEQPVELAGLHNVVAYAPSVVGGGQPEGKEGLETLAAMGIKTVISVDGAVPDVDAAKAVGIRYVHLPISYDTVTPERQKQLAQAVANCDGPIYVHCHHGKHRSSAALGAALVLAGKLTPETAQSRMRISGCAKEYEGLWKAVANAKPLDAAQLKADAASFPSVSKVSGMVATMAEIDSVFDLVKQAKAAKWTPPGDHPDLVPAKETNRLHLLFAGLEKDADSRKMPAEYQTILQADIEKTRALDTALRKGDLAAADQLFDTVAKSCKQCHTKYRDND